jgi:hypothetical protein
MLLEELKGYLKITWSEEDNELNRHINSGQSYLNEIAGTTLNFIDDESDQQLLFDYCRYAYNHSLELFETNFQRSLLKLSMREAVKSHEKTTSSDI